MISELNQTPKAMRLHIGVFGGTNAGKSTLINLLSGQEIAITSPVAGTTTDPVFKPMELLPLGPVVFIDTAGLDDVSELGALRKKKALEQLEICDAAILVVNSLSTDTTFNTESFRLIASKKIPTLIVINKFTDELSAAAFPTFDAETLAVDLSVKSSASLVKSALIKLLQNEDAEPSLTGDLVGAGDLVLLVMPQDIQAPKGRLILPQVQVLRDLLDNHCIAISVTLDNLENALEHLKTPPALVITDSQAFAQVNATIPKDIRLTSFSMLMAKNKSDILRLIDGAKTIELLNNGDKIMIIESCSHHEMDGDIARVKIPALLKNYTKKSLEIANFSGQLLPTDIEKYALVIHCGGCMVSRKSMFSKQDKLAASGVPMTNFGVAIAYMNGILDRCCF